MLLKAGVDISRLKPCIRKRLNTLEQLCIYYNSELIITSTYEGDHSAGSLHYANEAVDIDTPPKDTVLMVEKLKSMLGKDYDVVNEYSHIHIEYDPK